MTRRGHGEGYIGQRKDGLWAASLRLPNGKRRWFYGATRREVRSKLAKAQRAKQDGVLAAGPAQTVAAFLESWLETAVKPGVRPRTYESYSYLIKRHIAPTLGKRRLEKLTAQDVQALYAAKLQEGLSSSTVRRIHAVLHRAFEYAVRWERIGRNVCDLADAPRPAKPEFRALSAQEARALLKAAEGDPLQALYVLALTTAMRRGELLGLKWQDVDLGAGVLQVRRQLSRIEGKGFVEAEPKSAKSRRTIKLAPLGVAVLNRHRAAQLRGRLLAGSEWEARDLVFCNAFGRPLEGGNILRRSFAPLLDKAGLPHIRFHDLRHSAATLLLSLGVHPKIAQEFLGHSQISITMDVYSHALPSLQEDAVEKLNALLGG